MKYDKLVRDLIPEYIRHNGGDPVTHIAEESEFGRKLKEKLLEEVGEFLEAETIEEFVDVLEVLEAIAAFKQFDDQKIRDAKEHKARAKGQFKRRIILDEA